MIIFIIISVTKICAVQVTEERYDCTLDLQTRRSESLHRRIELLLDDVRELRQDFR